MELDTLTCAARAAAETCNYCIADATQGHPVYHIRRLSSIKLHSACSAEKFTEVAALAPQHQIMG